MCPYRSHAYGSISTLKLKEGELITFGANCQRERHDQQLRSEP